MLRYSNLLFGYYRILLYCLSSILLLVNDSSANAATRSVITYEIQRGSDLEKLAEVFTIDGERARLDIYPDHDAQAKDVPFMLTVDGGKTWTLTDEKNKLLCTEWDTKAFFKGIGELILYAEDLVGADVSEAKFDVVLDEPGPVMLGHKTRHMRIHSSINAKARILLVKREYILEFKDEIWTSPDLVLHPIEQAWFDAMSDTGYAKVDRLSKQWNQNVPGTVVKMTSDVTLQNVTKNKKRHKQERLQITKLENIKSSEIPPETFSIPDCEKVSKKEMERAARDMLRGGAR